MKPGVDQASKSNYEFRKLVREKNLLTPQGCNQQNPKYGKSSMTNDLVSSINKGQI